MDISRRKILRFISTVPIVAILSPISFIIPNNFKRYIKGRYYSFTASEVNSGSVTINRNHVIKELKTADGSPATPHGFTEGDVIEFDLKTFIIDNESINS